MGPTLFQYRLHFVFFAEVFLPHGIDRQTMGLGQLLGVALDRVRERLSELREIEDPDSPRSSTPSCHRRSKTPARFPVRSLGRSKTILPRSVGRDVPSVAPVPSGASIINLLVPATPG